jgi:hypothetical protein
MQTQGQGVAQGQGFPVPQRNPAFHAGQGLEQSGVNPREIALAVERANPGLRESNRLAFTNAVLHAVQQATAGEERGMERAYKGAQIGELSARSERERGMGEYYKGRAQATSFVDKRTMQEVTQIDKRIMNLETQRAKIPGSFAPMAQKQADMARIDAQLDKLNAQRSALEGRLQGVGPGGAVQAQTREEQLPETHRAAALSIDQLRENDPATYNVLVYNISNYLKANDRKGFDAYIAKMREREVSEEEIQLLTKEANKLIGK